MRDVSVWGPVARAVLSRHEWSANLSPEDAARLPRDARAGAAYEEHEPRTTDELDKWLAKAPTPKARGIDNLGPRDIECLPRVAREALVSILNQSEKLAAWPWQLLLSIMALIPKGPSADRAIGLLSSIMKWWSSARAHLGEPLGRGARGPLGHSGGRELCHQASGAEVFCGWKHSGRTPPALHACVLALGRARLL